MGFRDIGAHILEWKTTAFQSHFICLFKVVANVWIYLPFHVFPSMYSEFLWKQFFKDGLSIFQCRSFLDFFFEVLLASCSSEFFFLFFFITDAQISPYLNSYLVCMLLLLFIFFGHRFRHR